MLETDTNCSSEFQDFRHQIIRNGIAIVGFVQLFWATQNPKIQSGIMKKPEMLPVHNCHDQWIGFREKSKPETIDFPIFFYEAFRLKFSLKPIHCREILPEFLVFLSHFLGETRSQRAG